MVVYSIDFEQKRTCFPLRTGSFSGKITTYWYGTDFFSIGLGTHY